jgi:quinoprotein glucose dehydrogenase
MLYVRTIDGPAIHRLRASERPVRLPEDATIEQQGYAMFVEHCAVCHASNPSAAPSGMRPAKEIGADRIRATIRNGQAQMPAFAVDTLTDANLESLAAYLLNPEAGKIPDQPRRGGGNNTPPPPPPEGQTRFYGQFGALWHANNGMPAIGPPWSEIVAYDLNQGTIKWRVPLGTVSSLAEKGIKNTGSYRPTRNGPVVTAGGLIFIATASDRLVHAYDKSTGTLLWERELDANPDGIPAVYEAGGRQYIAFYAGTGRNYNAVAWKAGKPEAQGYYVFALPKK